MGSAASQVRASDEAIHRHERRHAAVTGAVAAAVVAACFALHHLGALQVRTALPSPGALLGEVAVFVFVFDFYFYGLHRLMHTRWLYRVHAVHHLSKHPRPLTALSFHPVEALLLLAYAPLAMLVAPIHLASVCVGGVLLSASIALAHWGDDFFPAWWQQVPVLRWIASPGVHDAHHRFFDYNFSATTSIPDRLFGSYREATGPGPAAD
jgi:sterol desaturase/sphingolipid hydroxylase (fatty acid hydroxylase superfamily)